MRRLAALGGSWTHIAARWVVKPLVGTGVTPNHLTTLRIATGVAACLLFARNGPQDALWGGILWLVSAFLDRADGELARIGQMQSRAGHLYDYYSDLAINSAFFLAVGVGLRHTWLDGWSIPLGAATALAMLLCCWWSEVYERIKGPGIRIWNGGFGFDADDGLYLLAPVAWLGWLAPVLVAAFVCTTLMAAVIAVRLLRLIRRVRAQG
jgi:phosphatidylglycerophosphate synthase